MKARIEWIEAKGQSFRMGEVEERHYCRRIWENGVKDLGCKVIR